MSKTQALAPSPTPGVRVRGILAALSFFVCAAQGAEPASPFAAGLDQRRTQVMLLAAEIAGLGDASRMDSKSALITSYENAYGRIGRIPSRWPTLVRRALVCRKVEDRSCLQSSIEAINKLGGINKFPLTHLFEVSRLGMSVATIQAGLQDFALRTGSDAQDAHSLTFVPFAAPDGVALTTRASGGNSAHVPAPVTAAAARPESKEVAAKTIVQKVAGRLSKLGFVDRTGFFLNALFILVTVSLLLAYFLFLAMRARKAERTDRLRALQDIQRLEDLRRDDKLHADHALWSEQLKGEVALETQKAHSEEILLMSQSTADAAIQAERFHAEELLKDEQLKVEQAIQAHKWRVAQAIKVEQLKTEQAIKAEQLKTQEAITAAKSHTDQAIDAHDQTAVRELVYVHEQHDELQEALNAEKRRREAQELKTEAALQTVEALKLNETRLLEAVQAEQRARTSESRIAAEKLKAAQQAAAALHASLVAMRALKADLERRVEEAMRAAEIRIDKARQRHATRCEEELPVGQIAKSEVDTPTAESIALKDARG